MVAGVVMLVAVKPGPETTVVPTLVVPVKTVAVPSTHVMSVPVCEHVVDCANAPPGKTKNAIAVETLQSSARRAVISVIIYEFLLKPQLVTATRGDSPPIDELWIA
jgi:hypothetical protein